MFTRRNAAQKSRQDTPENSSEAAAEPRRSRIGDRFGLVLRGALASHPYDVLQNVQLEDFLSLTYGPEGTQGALGREARRKVDFLLVERASSVPVLAIMLNTTTYGRDRRRPPEVTRDAELDRSSIITVLHVDPHELLQPETLLAALGPHLHLS